MNRYREEKREMNAYCKFAGIGLIPCSPPAGGRLARPIDASTTGRTEAFEALG
jgi:aryl-alcohol dehydrogenase-like predicted oxidoreductase